MHQVACTVVVASTRRCFSFIAIAMRQVASNFVAASTRCFAISSRIAADPIFDIVIRQVASSFVAAST
eukprot:CAMPEP_0194026678 /NCGR_PEP_ID=MMETSP0009_2-20130614/992_1 /TAXON_ID=210454 /ORGANISM="Grammatophora oceanica, Strain CCMP 410" /LENGTH=67 /DNA_ID=CAMNT_0038665515 /DNA_START=10 /DNA_END=210 /DNA_ORIENTATION=-